MKTRCIDCNMHTVRENEYFMIHRPLWESIAVPNDILCIGCTEARLGRELRADDFKEMQPTGWRRDLISDRMWERMHRI